MKQGDRFLKIVVIVLSVVVALYFFVSILKRPNDGYTLYTAALCEVGDGITTSGFVVRDETLLTSNESILALTRAEGERVAKGDTLANCYSSADAQGRQLELDALEEELAQMEYAYSISGAGTDTGDLDAKIVQTLLVLNDGVNRRELVSADSVGEELKTSILRRYVTSEDTASLWERITALKDKIAGLSEQTSGEVSYLTAEQAGYFSALVDGYETVLNAQFLETADTAQVLGLPDAAVQTNDSQFGKLVLSARWYLITAVDAAAVADCETGDTLEVRFSGSFDETVPMRLTRIADEQDGKCVMVLTADEYIQDTIALREQTVELLFDTITGLRVPKTAIYVNDDGASGVYVLEGAEAKWKTVEICYDSGTTYIVALDKSSTDNLWPEDEIILTDKEIFDGKVME